MYSLAMHEVTDIEIISDDIIGREGGFLALRRVRLKNRRADGTLSAQYLADFIVRGKGVDAVIVAVWTRTAGRVRVLLRDGLRIPLIVGRSDAPIPDTRKYLMFKEVVAGIIERGDVGEAGVKARAAIEVEEEAGFKVDPGAVEILGAGTFPSPGAMAERFWLTAVEVASESGGELLGDGSPMEEGAKTEWRDLDAAIAACVSGEIEDMKTELVLRRLRDRLHSVST
jgi:ADP-ribose pyrophosphatase